MSNKISNSVRDTINTLFGELDNSNNKSLARSKFNIHQIIDTTFDSLDEHIKNKHSSPFDQIINTVLDEVDASKQGNKEDGNRVRFKDDDDDKDMNLPSTSISEEDDDDDKDMNLPSTSISEEDDDDKYEKINKFMQGKCKFDPEKHLLIGLFDDYCVLYDKQNDKVIDSKKIGGNSENNKSANPTGYKTANEQSMSSNKRSSRTKSSTTQPKYASHVIENDTDLNSSLMRYNDDQAAAATSDVDLNYDAMAAPINDALLDAPNKFEFYNGDPRVTPKTIDGVSQLLREKFKKEDENNTATKETSQEKAVLENN